MAIADAELDKPVNAHLVRTATESVLDALRAWRAAPGSYEWWWLIVDHGSQHYTALRFEALRDLLQSANANITLGTHLSDLPPQQDNSADWQRPLPGVITPPVVEQSALSTTQALQQMRGAPGQLLVVLDQGQWRGILSGSQRTFAFADKPLLDLIEEHEQGGRAGNAPSSPHAGPGSTDPAPSET